MCLHICSLTAIKKETEGEPNRRVLEPELTDAMFTKLV
jgi:hypothetical protein